ncbi:hypothetical protein [Halobellus inordinatus]|uniref:DUF7845 domain-containing protein n=1 Tax=Halobellus inordinatus TaxID=1126236 RepID=UPI00210CBD93|nr:hypothetical protein [Halobellus inordinatus]
MSHQAPANHELDAFWWFTDNGLSPYWALTQIGIERLDGYAEIQREIGGEEWNIRFNYNADTGLAPRPSDPINGEKVYEWKIHVESVYTEAKADFVVSPRWDGLKKPNGDEAQIPWCGGEGCQIHVQGSNLELEEYQWLLQRALQQLAAHAGTDFSRRYFNRIRGDSNISTLERYVRIKREYGKKLTRSTGVFYSMMHLLADEEGSQWVYKGDNTDTVGYRHAMELDPVSSSDLIDDHHLGKRLKSYHPEYVRLAESEDDPLSSPKFGVAFHKSLNTTDGFTGEYRSDGHSKKWRDRDELIRELDETLVNTLRWAGVPIKPDPTVFVEDDHFEIEESERSIGYWDDPTPQLEAEQENLITAVLQDLSPSARGVMKTLATDGGQVRYDELADETGYSVSQIYRALEEIGDVVVNDNGLVRYYSEKIRQEITAIVERVENFVGSGIERVAKLANVETRSAADSAIQRWMDKYGVEFERRTDQDRGKIRFDTVLSELKSDPEPTLHEVLEEGLDAWCRAGRDLIDFVDLEFQAREVRGRDRDGGLVKRENITW